MNEDRAENFISTTIFKTDSSFSKNLSGAEFELYRELNGSKTRIVFDNQYKSVISAGNLEFTDANREKGIGLNLEFGKTYYFRETKAPKGHVLKKNGYLQVKVATDGAVNFDYDGDWSQGDIQFVPKGELKETREATLKSKNDTWVCKLTDETDHLLYQDSAVSKPAVYTTLEDGFEAARGTLYTKEGSQFSSTAAIRLKLLRDYELSVGIENDNQRALTLTTAELYVTAAMQEAGDEYTFTPWQVPSITEAEYDTATVQRNFNGDSMFTNKSELTLTVITLDGANNTYSATVDGGIVYVARGGSLTVTNGAVLQNAVTTENGGAVYADVNSTVNVNGGTINGNTAANGAGIYLAWSNADNYAVLNLSGSPNFGGTGTADASGFNPTAAISGPQYNADGFINNGNYCYDTLNDAYNGQ